jgi:hypothetical protein
MLGEAAVAMWWDVAPEMQAEWQDWHSHEHMPERLAIPGFLRGSRWISNTSYFVLYELDSPATLTGAAYLERLNNPTPWSRRMMPHHRNMVRSLCRVRARFGRGIAQALATVRAETPAHALGPLPERRGITSACLLESQSMAGMPQTTEQRIRGGDAEAGWITLIGGYDGEAVSKAAQQIAPGTAPGLYRLSYCLSAE